MNYGTHESERRLRALQSKSAKYTSKLFFNIFKAFFVLFLFLAIAGTAIGFGMVKGIIDSAPSVDLMNIQPDRFATTVYDIGGNLTDTIVTSGSNRESAAYEELPQDLIDAFVAIEDSRFWSHNGIDIRSIARAVNGLISDDYAGGGSTITQQLIKNNIFAGGMETSWGARIERKLQEQYLALQLEKIMDKEIILKNYLNTINLGNNTLGVKSAAKRYFGKDVSDLTLSEATVIAGITQNPTKYNPLSEKGQKNNEEKRRVILQYMYEQGKISKEDQEEALADDVYSRIQNVDLVTQESQNPYSYFTDELTEQVMTALQEKLGYTESQASNLLYAGGLSIYTTQDPDLQAIVDEEVNNPDNYDVVYYSVDYRLSIQHEDETVTNYSDETMKTYYRTDLGQTSYDGLFKTKEEADEAIAAYKSAMTKEGDTVLGEVVYYILQPQVSFVLMDQHTGYVKAVNGGRGTKEISLSLNRATNTLRQPGSTFKVLTAFAPALDTCGATLSTVYYDAPYTVGQKTFRNWYAKKGYMGYSTIRDGIVYSMNIVAVRCMMETVTPQLGVEYARNFGITSLTETDYNAATALGGITKGVSNLELTGAYAAIANGGIYTKPVFFTKILDHNGKVLLENEPQTKRVLKDSTAFLLTDALAESMESSRMYASPGVSLNSTSVPANIPGMSNAGKSGTTTSNVDIWFVGYTPYYTAGIWSGCDDNQKISAIGSSTSYHKRIWKQIMARAHEGLADTGFPVPDSIETASVCRKSGMLPNPGVCEADPRGSAVYTEYFAKGTVPTQVCDHHVAITVCGESGGLPTEFCPLESRHSRTVLVTPEGESGGTDDSRYAMPGPCTVHTQSAVVLPSENETAAPDNETVPETTAPFIPSSPLDDIYIPVGPGYM